ncbi:MAG: zf-HC2 domain-containing protein [Ignavibacteriales bacterium]|nr:zf-HC2 domain-containing protein [Ignavibacteriales bacterium]
METQEQASRFIDDELSDHERPPMFSHLASCPTCQKFLSDTLRLRSEIGEEKEMAGIPVPARGQAGTKAIPPDFFATSRSPWMRSRRVSLSFPIAAVLALFLIAASAVLTISTVEQEREAAPKEVILISLPTVEVQGSRLPSLPLQQ